MPAGKLAMLTALAPSGNVEIRGSRLLPAGGFTTLPPCMTTPPLACRRVCWGKRDLMPAAVECCATTITTGAGVGAPETDEVRGLDLANRL